MTAKQKVNDAIEGVIEKEPLFTNLVLELEVVEDKSIPTMGTDGEYLYYSPDFVDELTSEEIRGVILHEVLHCSFLHLWRREKRDKFKFNIAADYAINPMVNEYYKLPKGTLLDMKYYGMSAEAIYDDLPDPPKIKIGKGKNGKGNSKDKGKASSGKGKLKEQDWGDHSRWGKNGKKKKQSPIDKFMGRKPKSKKSEGEKRARWEKLFNEHVLKQYGRLPDSMKRIIEKEYYVPVIDWTALVSNLLSADTNDYTFSQPDRRFLESDFILPDLHSLDRLKDVVFAYDTSGSIEERDLRAFYVETMNLFNNFSSLSGWVAVCDARLHSFTEINPKQGFEGFGFVGGGRTSFMPVFREVKKRGMQPKALFYFTDTYGDFGNDPGYPVYWLVPSYVGDFERPESRHVPFGTVVPFIPKL